MEYTETTVNEAKEYLYFFKRAAITVDTVVFRELPFDDYEVLLIKRGGEPFKDMLALPGGYLEAESERILDGAYRELCEEVNPKYVYKTVDSYNNISNISINPIKKEHLKFVGYFDDPNRHPTDRVVNFAFTTLVGSEVTFTAGDDAKELQWVPVLELPKLAFDHAKIIHQALYIIRRSHYT